MKKSWLFVPASSERFLEKATTLPADTLILDLEDAVSESDKTKARNNAEAWIESGKLKPSIYVRVNGLQTLHLLEDLQAVVHHGLTGILLPKTDSAGDIHVVHYLLDQLERKRGLTAGSISIVPIIETAKGLHHSYEIACGDSRVQCLAFGVEDYKLDAGIGSDGGFDRFLYIRSKLCESSRAAGIGAPVDSVYTDIGNLSGLEKEAQHSRQLGFQGKLLVHPNQISVANSVFAPSMEEIAEAREILLSYGDAKRTGGAAKSVGGKMVDVPVAERARKLLEQTGELKAEMLHGLK